eukprot:5547788-Lingulodinium_polyedra.AAC.1
MARAPVQTKKQTMLGRNWAMKRGQMAPRRAPASRCCSRRRRQQLLSSSPRRRGVPGPERSGRLAGPEGDRP